jgi:hypothetical protein
LTPVAVPVSAASRRAWFRPRRSSTAVLLFELRGLLERQHAELMGEVHRLRQQRRNEHESLPAVLKRISEIERHLRLTEIPRAPRIGRLRPLEG